MTPAAYKGRRQSKASAGAVALARQMAKDWLTEVDADNRKHGVRPGWDGAKCTPTPENIARDGTIP